MHAVITCTKRRSRCMRNDGFTDGY